MGKSSSAKKVARAARAGAKTSKQRRKGLGFPIAMVAIVILGLAGVLIVRQNGQEGSDSTGSPKVGEHWHAAYGIYVCDRFVAPVNDRGQDVLGIHSHGDGLIHIHPFSVTGAGSEATLGKFFDQTGMDVTGSSIRLPEANPFDGRVYKEGETTCDGKPGEVQVVHWKSALAAAQGAEPDQTITSDISGVHLSEDLGAYVFAFVPKGTKIPGPPNAEQILNPTDVEPGTGGQIDPNLIDPTGGTGTGTGDTGTGDTGTGTGTDTGTGETGG